MKLRYLWAAVLLGGTFACGADDKKGNDDSAVAEADSARADDTESDAAADAPVPDSIPMTVTVTIPTVTEAAGAFHGGTFRSEGKGARCEHLTDGPMEWAVLFPGTGDSLGVGSVQLSVGRLAGGRTEHISVMAQAGTVEAMGSRAPLMHVISTRPPGPPDPTVAISGSGSATVTREGPRVRFEVDGVSGTTKKPFKMTLVCEREGKWV
jgi:hypothetical protein